MSEPADGPHLQGASWSAAPSSARECQANPALYRTVIVRMRWHEPTIAYVERRTAEGLSKKEIIRCLKRSFYKRGDPDMSSLNTSRGAPMGRRQFLGFAGSRSAGANLSRGD